MHAAVVGLGDDEAVADHHVLESPAGGIEGNLRDPFADQSDSLGDELVGGRARQSPATVGAAAARQRAGQHGGGPDVSKTCRHAHRMARSGAVAKRCKKPCPQG